MKDTGLTLVSALLLLLSFPNYDFYLFAWIALVPLLLVLKEKKLKSAFAFSFFFGVVFIASVFYWINSVSDFKLTDYVLPVLYLATYFGLFGLILNFISRKQMFPPVFTAPALWVSFEYLRSNADFLALPWALSGHTQYLNLPVIQIASFTGAYGVSFLIVMFNAALCNAGTKNFKDWKQLLAVLVVLTVSLGYGFNNLSKKDNEEKITVTIVQGNIAMDRELDNEYQRFIIEKQMQLTKRAAEQSRADLIVWSEGVIAGNMRKGSPIYSAVSALASDSQAYVMVGSSRRPKIGERRFEVDQAEKLDLAKLQYGQKVSITSKHYNSMFFFSSKGEPRGQYNKIRLLPFAEYTPRRNTIPWPDKYKKADYFTPGKEHKVFDINGMQFGAVICWESIFPDLFRQFVKNGATFMINITNEAWFGRTTAPYQFLSMNVFRAVENRVSIARSANTGISSVIDPYGRIIARVSDGKRDIFVEGYLTREFPIMKEKTFYTMYGDVFAYLCLVFSILAIAASLIKKDKQNN